MPGYCEIDDVGNVLQDDFAGANPATDEVQAAIEGQNEWVRRATKNHWYESSGGLTFSSGVSETNIVLDVPSSPHRQDRQLFQHEFGARYPRTHAGPYVKLRLPHYNVTAIDTLEIRERGGGVTDWVADSSIAEGRGDDYYVIADGDHGASYLYLHEATIGPRVDFGDLVTVDYTRGVEGIPDSVRRAVALMAAAELVIDDDLSVGIPSDGQLVALDTKADQYEQRANKLIKPYRETPIR